MPPLRIRMIWSPRPSAAMTDCHSLRAVWLGRVFIREVRSSKCEFKMKKDGRKILNSSFELRTSNFFRYKGNGIHWSLPDRDGSNDALVRDRRRQLAVEPLRNVLRRWIDRIKRRYVIDASVIELPGQQFELLSGADEINRYGVTVDATASGSQV